MIKNYKYELVKGSKKEICPGCGQKTFKRYVDTSTGEFLPLPSGRCDRINNCAYDSNPYKNGEAERIYQESMSQNRTNFTPYKKAVSSFQPLRETKQETPQYDTMPKDTFLKSGVPYKYSTNVFITYLREYFGYELTDKLIREYCIGNSLKDNNATVFWQVSYTGEIRTGKKITYGIVTNPAMYLGKDIKRVKTIVPYLVHTGIKPGFKVNPCFFGEHLLKRYPQKPIILVEAEKTAIIASLFYPDFVCIASGGSAGCKWATEIYAMEHLIGRKVVMYPDLKNTEAWQKKSTFLRDNGVDVTVSRKLLDIATPEDFANDNDLADYLLRYTPPKAEFWESIKKEQPRPLTKQRMLEKMINKNPAIENLIETLELELVR